ncbi:hypothetical protein OV207_37560 [Corallococcus sp. BB11-1]|uniref:hypothetical protein n=1 Tax=Corallococcus sp. BB11-1 TaxID=2996783 RepID=UPI002270407B|nr:hypothetical protein [Corallococcus sp. BB11-1]MCY1037193.1 hypothetical protein [Corallococcus sp. BB11-1]
MSTGGLRRGLALLTGVGMLLGPGAGLAQDNVNLYRFVLDVDVPESAGLVALDETPTLVLLGAAPKPVMVTLLASRTPELLRPGLALDVAPYFLFGGGIRSLSGYRSNSVAGRLMRVLTKTTLSVAVVPDARNPDSWRVGFGLRTTLHDPHDPVLNSPLPERVAGALASHGVAPPGDAEEDVLERGVDLSALFAEALRTMRARGDIRISAGWGVSARVEGDVLSADGLTDTRHTFWVSGQSALGPRFDVLATVQGLDVWSSERALRFGAGVQRKTTIADFRAELAFDGTDERLHPAVAVDVKLPGCTSLIAALTTVPGPEARTLRAQVQLRGYLAACP